MASKKLNNHEMALEVLYANPKTKKALEEYFDRWWKAQENYWVEIKKLYKVEASREDRGSLYSQNYEAIDWSK